MARMCEPRLGIVIHGIPGQVVYDNGRDRIQADGAVGGVLILTIAFDASGIGRQERG